MAAARNMSSGEQLVTTAARGGGAAAHAPLCTAQQRQALLQSAHSKCLLHDYNRVKDAAQALMGMVALQRGVPLREVYASLDVAVTSD